MAVDLTAAFTELTAELSGSAHAGESAFTKAMHVAQAVTKIVGQALDGLDEESRTVELPQLQRQVLAGVQSLADKLELGRIGQWGLLVALPLAIPQVLGLAAEKSDKLEAVRDAYLVPGLTEGIKYAAALRLALAPDAPPVGV